MKSFLQNIGDYQILEKLGRGGMADVYLALDRKTSRRIALKLVELGQGPDAQEILEAEQLGAELQQRISFVEPRVPQIHSFGDLEGYFFIEMEFVEGSDLSAVIGTGTLRPEDAAGIALELCGILRKAHGMSLQVNGRELRAIVHGDIKPKNIRIDTTGSVRVLDFGIAKGLSITRRLTSNIFGSVAYSSPERLESGSIDEMSDLWSVGIVLYEMVEGRLPFEAASTERLESIIRSRTPIRPLDDTCPESLQQIICKALARSPEHRYQNAAQFESDLEAFLSGEPTLASQESEQTRKTAPPAESLDEDLETRRTAVSPQPPPAPAVVHKSRAGLFFQNAVRYLSRKRWWIVAGSIFLLVGMGIWEGVVMRAASQLKPDFVQNRLDPDGAWTKYLEIRGRSILGIAPLVLRSPARNLLADSCERVFTEYRNSDTLRVRERDWMRCRQNMSRAMQLDPRDNKAEAMLEYSNGHISRINRKSFDAVASFERAAVLEPRWPDPHLGLARTYIEVLGDMERGTKALERAKQLGYSFGKRDLGMIAGAQRKRGLQDLENARLVRGTDQEKEFLKKAKNEFQDALDNYLQIAPWGDSTAQIPAVQESLADIEFRLEELNRPNPLLPWNWFD